MCLYVDFYDNSVFKWVISIFNLCYIIYAKLAKTLTIVKTPHTNTDK